MNQPYVYNCGLKWNQIFEEHSDSVALIYSSNHQFTFSDFEKQSQKMSSWLLHLGINQGDVVLIASQKSFDALSLWLACVRLGIVYAHMDITSPEARLRKIMDKANPKAIFFDSEIPIDCKKAASDRIRFDINQIYTDQFPQISSSDLLKKTKQILGSSPLYIMFTSGSTGFPKGAVMTHDNVLNLIYWSKETFSFSDGEIVTQLNPLYFDNSVFDLFAGLFNGNTLAIFTPQEIKEPLSLINKIENLQCTSWFSVPSLIIFFLTMRLISKNSLPHLKRFLFGGEGFPKKWLSQLYNLFENRIELFNVYGPTECTCICSSHQVTFSDLEAESTFVTLGEIASNFHFGLQHSTIFVPWNELQPNQEGELVLYGPNVGLGYYNDQELTQNKFNLICVSNWNYRAYFTGDWVKIDEKKRLYFLGRTDHQVKLMGYRIELEEIEQAFNAIDGVVESCVVLSENSFGLKQLKAVLTIQNDAKKNMISEQIKDRLPAYMIPKEYIYTSQLPKNSNGKMDRKKVMELYS